MEEGAGRLFFIKEPHERRTEQNGEREEGAVVRRKERSKCGREVKKTRKGRDNGGYRWGKESGRVKGVTGDRLTTYRAKRRKKDLETNELGKKKCVRHELTHN